MQRRASHIEIGSGQQGIALVLVLAFLVLLSALVVSFFATTKDELTAAKGYAGGVTTRQLADSAVQAVIGQVGHATSLGGEVAWASQPGMIKTYGAPDKTASEAPFAFYKLYSSDTAILQGAKATEWNPDSEITRTWHTEPALFVDLNAPLELEAGKKSYPIFDPSAAVDTLPGGAPPSGQPAVKGSVLEKNNPRPAGSGANPAPMPVRWVYVLKDGTMTAPAELGSKGEALWTSATIPDEKRPSRDNPIVGRVAYWTDDETCKVNINTAAGDEWKEGITEQNYAGTYWDTPRVTNLWEKQTFGRNQPYQKEYQRYPGHPATTYLSAVFPSWTRKELMDVFPRVVEGGSKGGTVGVPYDPSNPNPAPPMLVPDSDRLLATVDELSFAQPTKPQSTYAAKRDRNPDRLTGATSKNSLNQQALDRVRFFLTASSRAPEVNLFNQPRISIWPVKETTNLNDQTLRTPYDALIAFCATVGKDSGNKAVRYHFVRNDPHSHLADLSIGNSTGAQNLKVLSYLDQLTRKNVPGFGGSFRTKYATAQEQINTEIFDYIRSTNILDTSTTSILPFTPKGGIAGYGEVIPIERPGSVKKLRGFGRFTSINEVAILFYAKSLVPATGHASGPVPAGKRRIEMQAVLLIEPYGVAEGFTMYQPNHFYIASQLSNFRIAGARTLPAGGTDDIGFAATASLTVNGFSGGSWHQRGWCGPMGPQPLISGKSIKWGTSAPSYPFCSKVFYLDVEGGANTMRMKSPSGGDIEFSIITSLTNTSSPTTQLQKIDFAFPEVVLPVPTVSPSFSDFEGTSGRLAMTTADSRITKYAWKQLIQPEDVVRSLEISPDTDLGGDPRLHSLQTQIPRADPQGRKYFTPGVSYTDTTKKVVHSLRTASGFAYHNDDWANAYGKLVANVDYYHQNGEEPFTMRPNVSGRLNGVKIGGTLLLGDWDTGISVAADGAFINKPDDGQVDVKGYQDEFRIPYFSEQRDPPGPSFFTPNRMASSSVMFGSLPVGNPWQTLLFCPNPAGGTKHPGFGTWRRGGAPPTPPDHVLLDLFHMPVVEPYAISEPLSTAGRVNLNYQILPFTWITRSTALQAVLKSTRVIRISGTSGLAYKRSETTDTIRLPVDIDQTLIGFQQRFANRTKIASGDTFRSATEICDMYLVPRGEKFTNMETYWSDFGRTGLTGDNLRERPYAEIYPRLTTKSNSYTVHVRVQALRNPSTAPQDTWEEGRGQVVAEYRGSSTIERYVDPGDANIPDYTAASQNNMPSLDQFYRFRVVGTKRFGG